MVQNVGLDFKLYHSTSLVGKVETYIRLPMEFSVGSIPSALHNEGTFQEHVYF